MRTSYDLSDGVATITLDDGKVNALSTEMLLELGKQLDRAEADGAVVVLAGRESTFSAGFDLRTPMEGWPEMLRQGARMAERLLSFPRPTVAACNGNAIAMGAFLLLACDVRVGTAGDFKIGLNEAAIGLTMPWFGVALARHRLARPWFDRCTVTGALLGPDDAQAAGFLDHVEADAAAGARDVAGRLLGIHAEAHAATKLRIRERVMAELQAGIERGAGGDW